MAGVSFDGPFLAVGAAPARSSASAEVNLLRITAFIRYVSPLEALEFTSNPYFAKTPMMYRSSLSIAPSMFERDLVARGQNRGTSIEGDFDSAATAVIATD